MRANLAGILTPFEVSVLQAKQYIADNFGLKV